jgi:hypothetical protein
VVGPESGPLRRTVWILAVLFSPVCVAAMAKAAPSPPADRIVILKVDGLGADLLSRAMQQTDPDTHLLRLPWFHRVFEQEGLIFDNFYTRGISLSAPSWSMLDSGRHLLIKGNVEYDRYTGRPLDYLNIFPFYVSDARFRHEDMPEVEVLDAAGVPLLIDQFRDDQRYQSFQLYQRGVRWRTLQRGLEHRLTKDHILSFLEDPQSGMGLDKGIFVQSEFELRQALQNPAIRYVDLYIADIDHVGHSVNDERVLMAELSKLDMLLGRVWSAIQDSGGASRTLLVLVSDHGMNNVPEVYSQTFALTDLLNSTAGGAHHVITSRPQLSDFKMAGLDPFIERAVTPSAASFYLRGQSGTYPTAVLDLDGNERASVSLRNSELNRVHILLQQLARPDLDGATRRAVAIYLRQIIEQRRPEWTAAAQSLSKELDALRPAIRQRQMDVRMKPRKWSKAARRRKIVELHEWQGDEHYYGDYLRHINALLDLHVDEIVSLDADIGSLVPPRSLGERNSVYDLQNYVAGPSEGGIVLNANGEVDEKRSFRHVDYFALLASQRVRNNPQEGVPFRPIDFMAAELPVDRMPEEYAASASGPLRQAIWLYGDDEHQLVELVSGRAGEDEEQIRLVPVEHLRQNTDGIISWTACGWGPDLPFKLFEDPNVETPDGSARAEWLSSWHSEGDWMRAIHRGLYSDGVIGITEELLPPAEALPGAEGPDGELRRLEVRRRELAQADFHVFASDHWNFDVRNFNPGGNHGSFLRISTHSVWMMSGAGVPRGAHIENPYDSLNFASTIWRLLGFAPPLADRAISVGSAETSH